MPPFVQALYPFVKRVGVLVCAIAAQCDPPDRELKRIDLSRGNEGGAFRIQFRDEGARITKRAVKPAAKDLQIT